MAEADWDEAEMLDFWNGTLVDVKETKNLIPPTRNVKVKIKDVKLLKEKNDEPRPWKMLVFSVELVDGIMIGEETKYRGMSIGTDLMCYFADPDCGRYDYKKPYFAKGQFLVPLMQVVKATGVQAPGLMKGGISDENMAELVEELDGQVLMANILQKKVEALNNETGKYEATDELKNAVSGFKAALDEDMV